VDDYVHSPGRRLATNSVLAVATFFLIAIGSITIFTFQPVVR
jgi:succinate dehydrogenase hydrophobic anchor subunit